MPGTSVGIFWIDIFCRPAMKGLLKSPELALALVFAVYACIAWRCVRSAWEVAD